MTNQQWNELYSKLYASYDDAGNLGQEYVRSTLGEILDRMIALKSVTV
jgi:hypothetical protein